MRKVALWMSLLMLLSFVFTVTAEEPVFTWEGLEWGMSLSDAAKQLRENGICLDERSSAYSDKPLIWSQDSQATLEAAYIESGMLKIGKVEYMKQVASDCLDFPVHSVYLSAISSVEENRLRNPALCGVILYLDPEACGMTRDALFDAAAEKLKILYGEGTSESLEDGVLITWLGGGNTVLTLTKCDNSSFGYRTTGFVALFYADRTAEEKAGVLTEWMKEQRRTETAAQRASDNRSFLDSGNLTIPLMLNKSFARTVLGEYGGWQFTLTRLSKSEDGTMTIYIECRHPEYEESCFIAPPRDTVTVDGRHVELTNFDWPFILGGIHSNEELTLKLQNPDLKDVQFALDVYPDRQHLNEKLYQIGPVTLHFEGDFYDVSDREPIQLKWSKTEEASNSVQIESYLTLAPVWTNAILFPEGARRASLFLDFQVQNVSGIPLKWNLVNASVNGLRSIVTGFSVAPGKTVKSTATFIIWSTDENLVIPASADEITSMEFCVDLISGEESIFLAGPYIVTLE